VAADKLSTKHIIIVHRKVKKYRPKTPSELLAPLGVGAATVVVIVQQALRAEPGKLSNQ